MNEQRDQKYDLPNLDKYMQPTTSGNTNNTIAEKHAKTVELINEYLTKKIGINIQPSSEVNKYLNLTPTDIKKMSAEECGEASFILGQYCVYIQVETNKLQADINWCEKGLNHIISGHIQQYVGKFIPSDQVKSIIINSNEAATQLNTIIVAARLRWDTLQFLPAQIKLVIESLNSIQRAKRSEYAGR